MATWCWFLPTLSSVYGLISKVPLVNPLETFKRIQTLRELLNIPSFVFFPEVKYVHIWWSTLRINFGQDLGFWGSPLWFIVARIRQICCSILKKEVSKASTLPVAWQQSHGSLTMNVTLGRTLFRVISMSPCLDNSETFTTDLSLSIAFLTSS